MQKQYDVAAVARQFAIDGEFLSVTPFGSGHINDSYCTVFQQVDRRARFVLQRINHHVFKNPIALMENIQRVTSHLAAQVAGQADSERRVLSLIPGRDGCTWHQDVEGNYWRAYRFIEDARTYDVVETMDQAFQAAQAFGRFQKLLAGMGAPRLHDTIPDFHNTPKRVASLEKAVASDLVNRANLAKAEIDFAFAHRSIASALCNAGLPERVIHNDTKFNNVMLDDATGEGICVIDLDTVMPGLTLYDFGDMVRTATCSSSEDERDLSRVEVQFPMFEALARGYLSPNGAGGFLTNAEQQQLAFSGKLIAYEQGVRFLTDYLAGDPYYKIHREGHNLDRCRTQFKLVESIERQEEAMQRLIESVAG